MAFKVRRRVFKIGGSKACTLPKESQIGKSTTMACGSRLILADTTGQFHEDDLLRFVIEVMEPMFWDWWRQEQAKAK
jgi:hypothetical protein